MNTKMSNKTYDTLKWIAQYFLPGLATGYFALAQIWGLPYADQIVGLITAVDTVLGVLLGVSTSNYKKSDDYGDGKLLIDTSNPAKDIYRLVWNQSLDTIKDQTTVTFKVDPNAKLEQDS